MPNWPTGVETTQIIFGKGITAAGEYLKSTLEITPIFQGTGTVVWDADGTPILPILVKANADSGQFGMVSLPVVDQPGWVDDSQAPYAMWGYRLTEKYDGASPRVKFLQPLMGQAQIDFDRIPDGNIGLPASGPIVAVTSVAELTGAVSAESLRTALGPLPGGDGGPAEWGYVGGTIEDQTDLVAALDARVPTGRTVNGKPLTSDVDLDAQSVGALPDTYKPDWIDIANVPLTFAPIVGTSAATAAAGDDSRLSDKRVPVDGSVGDAQVDAISVAKIAGAVPDARMVAGKALTADVVLAKGDVGLGNADDTADADKPVSTAQAAALEKRVRYIQWDGGWPPRGPGGLVMFMSPLNSEATQPDDAVRNDLWARSR